MNLTQKLSDFADAIGELDILVFHYWRTRPEDCEHYVIWAEDDEGNSFGSDNHKQEQGIHGTIDLFSLTEFDEFIDIIQNFLNDYEGVSWRLNSTQYEDETALTHHEWEFWLR